MAISLAQDVRQAMLDQITAQVDAGTGAGKVRIYSGTRPANANTALSGNTLLVEFTLTDPSAAAATAAIPSVLAFDADPDISATAVATGTASFARVVDSDNNAVFDGDVGTSSADFVITSTSITTGQTINLTSGTLTL